MPAVRSAPRAFLAALLLAAAVPAAAWAAWPHDPANGNLPLNTAPNLYYAPNAVADGAGGAFVVWYGSLGNDIYVQHVNATGVPLWAANGAPVCTFPAGQVLPVLTTDGAGGVIVAWIDARNSGQSDIYAQRVNASGAQVWTTDGVPVCTVGGDQIAVRIVSDGAGGAIIAWQDFRNLSHYDIYAQRVNASGAMQWTANGVLLSGAVNDQNSPTITADNAGGAIVAWQDQRAGAGVYDLYGQRVNAAGTPQWTANGAALCTATGNQFAPLIVSDGGGGAITTWYDLRGGVGADIYAQHTSATGAPLWNGNGAPICTATNDQNLPAITADGSGGAVIAWADYRNGGVPDVFAQRINGSGTTLWAANGVALCTYANSQSSVSIAPDGAQGAVVAWQDLRGFSTDLYAQRVSASGTPLWATDGVPVSTAVGSQASQTIAPDGSGGAILAWADQRDADGDIYAQRIERFGQLGNPEPFIVNVRDVPSDQGGQVSLQWQASYLDADPWNLVTNYWVWRQAPRSLALEALASGARLEDEGATPESSPGGLWKVTSDAAQTYFWEYVGTQPAQGFAGYSYVAATTGDSLAGSNPRTYFMVEAKSSGSALWSSAPDSGYSVDNLSPAAPAPFSGQYAGGEVALHWGVSPEPDFAEYRLYRGTTAAFVPGPSNLVAAQPDTGFVDAAAPAYYKLAAVDVHGNVSGYALLLPTGTLAVDDSRVPDQLEFALLRGNPVRGRAEFRLALPRAGTVRVALFDQQGRLVRELARGELPAGAHTVSWDGRNAAGEAAASGIYFGRLEAGGRSLAVKLAIVH